MEEALSNLHNIGVETNEQSLPPGYRFRPTDEELIVFYLASKVLNNGSFSCGVQIAEIDINRCEPWELPDTGKIGGEREWYFFSLKDRKYPFSSRTKRATEAGYWKATGKDKGVYYSACALVGMKKTLVFYKGRAPRAQKTDWVMHEYRLVGDLSSLHTSKEEWVICRIIHKAGGGDEKRIQILMSDIQFQSSPLVACSSPPCVFCTSTFAPYLINSPPAILLEPMSATSNYVQNPNLVNNTTTACITQQAHHQYCLFSNDLNIQPSFSSIDTNPPPSMLFKSLLSHQHHVPFQYDQPDANYNLNSVNETIQPNKLFFDITNGGTCWGFSPDVDAAAALYSTTGW